MKTNKQIIIQNGQFENGSTWTFSCFIKNHHEKWTQEIDVKENHLNIHENGSSFIERTVSTYRHLHDDIAYLFTWWIILSIRHSTNERMTQHLEGKREREKEEHKNRRKTKQQKQSPSLCQFFFTMVLLWGEFI